MDTLEVNQISVVMPFVADRYDTSQVGLPVNMGKFDHALHLLEHGAGATGTATITMEACDDASATNPVAIPFRYRRNAGSDTGDTWSDMIFVTSAGFTITAGNNQQYAIEVDAGELKAAGESKKFLRIKATEVVNSPVLGGCVAIMSKGRYNTRIPQTAIA